MTSYVSVDDFKVYARSETSTVDDILLSLVLDAAKEKIDTFCARSFDVAGASSARSYRPVSDRSQVLRIHDCTSVTSVVENGTTLAASEYQLEPIGGRNSAGQQRPYDTIRTYRGCWWWDYDFTTVTVTATWGWTATPPAVVEACKIIAKDILSQRNINSGVAGFGEFGAVPVRMNRWAIELLSPFRRAEAWGISA